MDHTGPRRSQRIYTKMADATAQPALPEPPPPPPPPRVIIEQPSRRKSATPLPRGPSTAMSPESWEQQHQAALHPPAPKPPTRRGILRGLRKD